LYHRGVDNILCHFLAHEEVEVVLNEFHSGACGGHLSNDNQKAIVSWLFLAINFKDYIEVVKKCHLTKCSLENALTPNPSSPSHHCQSLY